MTNKAVLLSVFVFVIYCLLPAPAIAATAPQTLQVEATSYVVSSQWLPVGDEAGHVIGIQQREGEVILSNGETARYSTVSTFDARRGKEGGTSQGYSKFIFMDESLILFSWTASISREQDGLTSNQGQGIIIKGTGRFEGIIGTSAFSGKQLKPAAEDPGLTAVQHAAITYTLP